MISLSSFIEAVHDAIIKANETLFDKSEGFLQKFFIQDPQDPSKLLPRTVILKYPHLTSAGEVVNTDVQVPLVTLVPMTNTQIEKATFTIEFEVEEYEGELQINFIKPGGFFRKKPKANPSKIEIVITPQPSPEGIKMLVEGYEKMLRRQFS